MKSSSKKTGSDKGEFTLRMIDYIKANFSDVLGQDVNLLDRPDGLDVLRAKYSEQYQQRVRKAA